MRVWAFAAWPALLLAGCGDAAEDFAVAIKRPVAAVYAPLLAVDAGEARIVFPCVTFVRTRPSDGEILYTIPGDGSFTATIRLRLESQNGGETTVVHAIVNVPKVHARIDGQDKVLSEARIERQLESLLKSTGRSLEMGSSAQAETMRRDGRFERSIPTPRKTRARWPRPTPSGNRRRRWTKPPRRPAISIATTINPSEHSPAAPRRG